MPMTVSHLGPIIRRKEDDPRPYYQILFEDDLDWCFFGKKNTCTCGLYLDDFSGIPIFPMRCPGHNTEFMTWKRTAALRDKIIKVFDYKRHMFIKMLTISLHRSKLLLDDLPEQRTHGLRAFHNLRKSLFWKKHVDGGVWFYESTFHCSDEKSTVDRPNDGWVDSLPDVALRGQQLRTRRINWNIGTHTTAHPHLHCLVLSPKKIPMDLLNQELGSRGLGDAWITVPKDKEGNIIKDENMSIKKALGYALSYVKKQTQEDGRNRGTFGCLYG